MTNAEAYDIFSDSLFNAFNMVKFNVCKCKDCKYFDHNFEGCICNKHSLYKVIPNDDWFCVDGEWKNDEQSNIRATSIE